MIAPLPGYARGLALHGGLAFAGLPRIRENSIFGSAPIAAYHGELKCGVGVIELQTGQTVATLQFATGLEEIFNVQVVPGARCPTFGGSPGDADEVCLRPTNADRCTSRVDLAPGLLGLVVPSPWRGDLPDRARLSEHRQARTMRPARVRGVCVVAEMTR